jgi:hypothetical protein
MTFVLKTSIHTVVEVDGAAHIAIEVIGDEVTLTITPHLEVGTETAIETATEAEDWAEMAESYARCMECVSFDPECECTKCAGQWVCSDCESNMPAGARICEVCDTARD